MNNNADIRTNTDAPYIGGQKWNDFVSQVEGFHGYAAPGVLLGGIMVEMARKALPEGILFDALAETNSCLPDAVQMLTPCTYGNGWLKVLNTGRYAVSLYNKHTGDGVRVYVDGGKLAQFKNLHDWLLNLVDKKDQDEGVLKEEIRIGGAAVCSIAPVHVDEYFRTKKKKGRVINCPICGEPYPLRDGGICKGCQASSLPFSMGIANTSSGQTTTPNLMVVNVEDALGKQILHDMTQIIPGTSKGPVFRAGQTLNAGDLCQLHLMGRNHVYLHENLPDSAEWVHENEVALAFGKAMAGSGVSYDSEIKEGKVKISAAQDGLLVVDEARLEAFNLVPGVMCAAMHSYSVVKKDMQVAGSRAIPLYLARESFLKATHVLGEGPIFSVKPMRQARVAILVTGTEVFRGLVEDKFAGIISAKVKRYDCGIVHQEIVPDEAEQIATAAKRCLANGADLIITTAGLSVDPDDVTRKGLIAAGLSDDSFGMPVLPGAMTLVGKIGPAQILGVPACALFHKITAMDILLPRLLAGLEITRSQLAKLGHGGLCLECKACTFPHCGFGK